MIAKSMYSYRSGIFQGTDTVYDGVMIKEVGELKMGFLICCIAFLGVSGSKLMYKQLFLTIMFLLGYLFLGNFCSLMGNILFLLIYIAYSITIYQNTK